MNMIKIKKYFIVPFFLMLQISVCFADGPNMRPTSSLIISVDFGISSDNSVISVFDNYEYFFNANVKWQNEQNPWSYTASGGSDVYFGVLSPDRDKVWTWSPENNELQGGYVAYQKKLTENEISINKTYLFSENEPKGMFLLFVLLVEPDADPGVISNWQYIDSKPFFYN